MRIDLEIIKKIEAYLAGKMDPADVILFEKEISLDSELKEAVEQQKKLMKAMEKEYVKRSILKAGQRVRMYSILKKGGIIVSVLVILTAAFWGYTEIKKQIDKKNSDIQENVIIPDMEKGKVYDPGAFITSQYFEIEGNKDTVIVGANGTMFAIPAGSFVDGSNNPVNGKITIELKEALDPGTIMLSGLSTFSDDQPLETGGMFYINAKANGQDLKIGSEGILSSVPQTESKPGMMIFDGVVDENGNINWVNPQQPEQYLLPVDMSALDFYPLGFVDAINNNYPSSTQIPSSIGPVDTLIADTGEIETHDHATNNEEAVTDPNTKLSKHFTDSLYLSFDEENKGEAYYSGKNIYEKNGCGRCHYTNDQKFVGPGLQGVTARWVSKDDLIRFIQNPSEFLRTGNRYANDLFKAYNGSAMPSYNLSNVETGYILDYLDGSSNCDGIRPSKVLAFWQPSFNQTFLATKEFESRMPLIHQTCNNAILDLYTNNLDKKLYEVDSMAAQMAGGLAPEFLKFAAMKHGRIPNGDKKYDMLNKFYQQQAFVMAQTAITTTKAFYEKNQQADLEAIRRGNQFANSETERTSQLFMDEFSLNLKKVYKDLGYDKPVVRQGITMGPRFTSVITNPGWKNVDRLVYESLITRSTFDYTDTVTGKRSIIEYKEMIANVTNAGEFDMLNVYLIPDKLSTYMKVNGSGGKYSEKLNMTINYDIFVIGYKNKQVYFQSKHSVLPEEYSFTLSEKDITSVTNLMHKLGSKQNTASLKMAVNYSMFKIADDERRTKYEKVLADRKRLRPIVFPCASFGVGDTLMTDITPTDSTSTK